VVCFVRHQHGPARGLDREPLAAVTQSTGGARHRVVERRHQHAELVAAEPLSGAVREHRGGELAAQARQQRIAGEVPERPGRAAR
jgi:hypothetical protein